MGFNSKITELQKEIENATELMDFMEYCTDNEEMNKIFRLTSAILYAEKSGDKEIIKTLKENIAINVKKNSRK